MDDGAPIAELKRGDLYDRDFYAWGLEQAALLRTRDLDKADIDNIAEEIEGLSKTEKRELVSRLTVLLLHLLKWRYQADRRGASWEASIRVQRFDTVDHLDDNPSLQAAMNEIVARAYRRARVGASGETESAMTIFPETCPWSTEQIMDDAFWPT